MWSCDVMMGYDMMGGWNWLGALLAIALVVLIVVGITWLVRQLGTEGSRRRPERSAIAELDLRYARGEVDRETYIAIRRDLVTDDS